MAYLLFSNSLGTPFYPSQPVYQSAPIIVPTQQQPPPTKREKKTVRSILLFFFNLHLGISYQINLYNYYSCEFTIDRAICYSPVFSTLDLEDLCGHLIPFAQY